jgi:hypothetical protein
LEESEETIMGGIAQALTDKDFLEAPQEDQKKYLSSIDSDFAKATPEEQNAYHSSVVLPAVKQHSLQLNAQPTQFEKERTPQGSPTWRAVKAFGSDVGGALSSVGDIVTGGPLGAIASAPKQAAALVLADQNRKEAGYSPLYRGAAALGGIAGVNAEGMEEAAKHGDTAGVVGHTALPAIGAAMGADQALTGGKATGALGKIPGKAVQSTLDTLGNPYTLGMDSGGLLTKGVRPRARAQGWQEAIQSPGVQRAIKEADAASPIQGNEDFHDAIGPMKEKLWNEKVQPALDRQGPRPVDMKPAAQAVRDAITPEMREFNPTGVAQLEDLAGKLEKSRTVDEASNLQKYANGQLESYFSKYPTARRSALTASPDTLGWETARRAIREQLNKTMEDAGETQAADARKDYGHLTTIEKELERKVNPNERKAPFNLARTLGLIGALPTAGLSVLAGETISHLNNPDVLVRRGIAKMNPPAEAPFTPPPAFKPPAPPAVQQSLPLPPENAPLFNIQQTPKLRPDFEEPRLAPIHGEQLPLQEHSPFFDIQQTPKLKPDFEEPRLGQIHGEQQPLGLAPPEAPLFNIQTPNPRGRVPELQRIGGTAENPVGMEQERGLGVIGGHGKTGELGRIGDSEPRRVYRAQDVGETKLNPRSHAHATESLEEAEKYKEGRESIQGKPQEVRSVNLSKLKPEDYTEFDGPNGKKWVKFNRQLSPHELEEIKEVEKKR